MQISVGGLIQKTYPMAQRAVTSASKQSTKATTSLPVKRFIHTTQFPPHHPFSIVQIPVRHHSTVSNPSFKEFIDDEINAQRTRFVKHPLLDSWFSKSNDSATEKEKLRLMMPTMQEFAFGFQDFNKWALFYIDAPTGFHKVINSHTEEDMTHAKLFWKEWKELDIDPLVNWKITGFVRAGMSPRDGKMKEAVLKLYDLVLNNPHPFARFAIMEAVETAGKEFFEITAPIADKLILDSKGKQQLLYFGSHHLELESGHMEVEDIFKLDTDELKKEADTLTEKYGQSHNDPEFREHIKGLIKEVGDIFMDVFDQWHEDATTCLKDPDYYKFPAIEEVVGSNIDADSSLKAFVLVDVLGSAFLCRFFDFTSEEFSESDNQKLAEYSKQIATMGDDIASDCDKIGIDANETSTSEVLKDKFFRHPFNDHRENLISFFKKMILTKDASQRLEILDSFVEQLREFNKRFDAIHQEKGTKLLGNSTYFDSLLSQKQT